jgi:hypothetical protein
MGEERKFLSGVLFLFWLVQFVTAMLSHLNVGKV